MRNIYILIIIIVMTITARESYAMRCGGKLIRVGDYVHKMVKHCGRPLAVYTDIFGSRMVFVYDRNGREQLITVIDDVIKGGV